MGIEPTLLPSQVGVEPISSVEDDANYPNPFNLLNIFQNVFHLPQSNVCSDCRHGASVIAIKEIEHISV